MLKPKVNNVCVDSGIKHVLLFHVRPAEDETGRRVQEHSDRIGNFIQRHINFEEANESDENADGSDWCKLKRVEIVATETSPVS